MTYQITQALRGYILIICREDGTRNDYRFNTTELNRWLKLAGIR